MSHCVLEPTPCMGIQASENQLECNRAAEFLNEAHEWPVALHYRSLTRLVTSWFSVRKKSLQSSSVP